MPITLGVVARSRGTAFTLDICNPLQTFSHSPLAMAAIMPQAAATRHLREWGRGDTLTHTLRPRLADAPDPPPPKTRA